MPRPALRPRSRPWSRPSDPATTTEGLPALSAPGGLLRVPRQPCPPLELRPPVEPLWPSDLLGDRIGPANGSVRRSDRSGGRIRPAVGFGWRSDRSRHRTRPAVGPGGPPRFRDFRPASADSGDFPRASAHALFAGAPVDFRRPRYPPVGLSGPRPDGLPRAYGDPGKPLRAPPALVSLCGPRRPPVGLCGPRWPTASPGSCPCSWGRARAATGRRRRPRRVCAPRLRPAVRCERSAGRPGRGPGRPRW